ncbi:MAG TPA: carbamoyltransferase HypF [Thermoanaerobaculia bacterium]|jgi:hydrogenase maturation protein HypF|nr:carbamoyltransferase HypF [Thermoanaerobaculia bacterium]
MTAARRLRVHGVVQGVGFRPFVYRLARSHGLRGWVSNAGEGVLVHVEGEAPAVDRFVQDLQAQPPPASRIADVEIDAAESQGFAGFEIRDSAAGASAPTVRISPDLPVCASCLAELFSSTDRRRGYPYINCTDCGPRYSIVLSLPYDRPRTTMRDWPLCPRCATEYEDPADRRFHAQPVACPDCGPHFHLGEAAGEAAIREAARRLGAGEVLAVKGIGGYHLACDARNPAAVAALRERKFRKEKPFALMTRDLDTARRLIDLSPEAESLLTSLARPVVLAPARVVLAGAAPENGDLGVMLPYAPLHHLLFSHGAPDVLVMTSANRSSEPIAYEDGEAIERLAGIADAFLIGERPIARRVDDSVGTVTSLGPTVLRRARGYAPGAVAKLPAGRPILALGGDLKNTITLVVHGDAFVSQHLGDLGNYDAFRAFQETVRDLTAMYEVEWSELLIVHDRHPEYVSSLFAQTLSADASGTMAVQHHRAHVASVLAEQGALERRVLGVAFDGTGYGDDGAIWGSEFFVGSVRKGFARVAHLRPAVLPGGDAAARHPVQAAAGFLTGIENLPDLAAAPFHFPLRYGQARELIEKNLRIFPTTSAGRLFDTAAALLGFTREISFEGQAAIWLEHRARTAPPDVVGYPMPFHGEELDFRPLLAALIEDRKAGRPEPEIARAFHHGLAAGIAGAVRDLASRENLDTVVLSGGVFQNRLLIDRLAALLVSSSLAVWTNREVPANDGGLSLGQAALAYTPFLGERV